MTNDPVHRLETSRLILRSPAIRDAEALCAIGNDINVARHVANLPHPFSDHAAKHLIMQAQSADDHAVVRKFLVLKKPDTDKKRAACLLQ